MCTRVLILTNAFLSCSFYNWFHLASRILKLEIFNAHVNIIQYLMGLSIDFGFFNISSIVNKKIKPVQGWEVLLTPGYTEYL